MEITYFIVIAFWTFMIWWKADTILGVLKDIRDILRKGGK